MTKIVVSLPDWLVTLLDAEAERRGSTRSGVLRACVEEALGSRAGQRAARISELLSAAPPVEQGGRGVEELKHLRPTT